MNIQINGLARSRRRRIFNRQLVKIIETRVGVSQAANRHDDTVPVRFLLNAGRRDNTRYGNLLLPRKTEG
jgi:hypothetical protein